MQTYLRPDGSKIVVSTGCIGKQTLIQGLVLGIVLGPIMWAVFQEPLWWCCVAMFLAPFLVDAIKPIHTYYPPNEVV